jgi:hypothetical protein
MTGEFPPSGEGRPSNVDIVATREYLKIHNRDFSVRCTRDELVANGFDVSTATVGRILKKAKGGNPPNPDKPEPTQKAAKRNDARRTRRKKEAAEEPLSIAKMILPPEKAAEIATLAGLLAAENSSTALAIRENRTRMALNVVIMEEMAARPALMLLDMRGSAALIDALTVAAKLSGGASIDITVPSTGERAEGAAFGQIDRTNGVSPNGHTMKDITPAKGPLSDELEAFRSKRKLDAQRA